MTMINQTAPLKQCIIPTLKILSKAFQNHPFLFFSIWLQKYQFSKFYQVQQVQCPYQKFLFDQQGMSLDLESFICYF